MAIVHPSPQAEVVAQEALEASWFTDIFLQPKRRRGPDRNLWQWRPALPPPTDIVELGSAQAGE